jgi:hypothetical protein
MKNFNAGFSYFIQLNNNSELEIKRCHSQNFVTVVPKISK